MHLKSLIAYSNLYFTLQKGETTVEREDITEAHKKYLIETFPEDFEVIPELKKEFKIETPEDKLSFNTQELTIETKEVKANKYNKKGK